MEISQAIEKVLDKVYERAKPVSVFVYGSRARGDFEKDSDYEVGVLFERDKKWGRLELAQLHNLKSLNLYTFVYEDFIAYSIDTPFPRAVYMRELLRGSRTVRGEKVVEKMEVPAVKVSDLLEVGTFQLAYALASVLSSRQADWVTTSLEFTKSVLFGARVLVILEKKKFPLKYSEIAGSALKLELEPQFKSLIRHAIGVRAGAKVDPVQLYTNITFLNQVVLQRVKHELNKGNKVVLRGKQI